MNERTLRRIFDLLAVAETLTLIVLLVNMATSHNKGVTSSVGPLHGAFYLAVIIVALLIPRLSNRIRLVAAIPAIGAPLAVWMMRRQEIAAT